MVNTCPEPVEGVNSKFGGLIMATKPHFYPQNPPFSYLPRLYFLLSAIVALHLSRALYKSTLFMQNKPNLLNTQINVTSVNTMNYEQLTTNYANKNKPNSNPIAERV